MTLEDLSIYLIRREKDPWKGLWCFPGGTVEQDETYQQAMEREIKEETGYSMNLFDNFRPVFV
jgi:8-oxo-dGTP diphosphatase